MKLSKISKLTSAIFSLTFVCLQPQVARAGGQGFSGSDLPDSKQSFESSGSSDLGVGRFESSPFQISVSARAGYDDNVFLSSFDEQESFFTSAQLGLTYTFGGPRTRMNLNVNAGVTYYFDTEADFDDDFGAEDNDNFDDYNVNLSAGFSIVHRATPRLTLSASLFAGYFTQPDFATFNQTTITVGRQSRDFFTGNNRVSAAFAWTPRFSTNTSYSLGLVLYDDDLISTFEDRFEHVFGNEFRFLVLPTTSAIAEYRFGFVDYTETDGRNSHSHFLLAGVDHSFSPRFNVSARAGVEFREFENDFFGREDENRTSPYAEATLNYSLAQATTISWFNRFSLEQPDVPESFSRQTFRTALSVRHNFTARISASATAAYQHDDNEGSFDIGGFDEDSFDLSLGVRYAISRNWAIDAGYQHTQVISDEALFREFSRNRYYVGATFTF